MKWIILKEGEKYNFNELNNLFGGMEVDDISEIFSKLLEEKVLFIDRYFQRLEHLNPNSTLLDFQDEKKYSFRYVGAIQIFNGDCLLIYPKYMSDESINKDIRNNFYKFKLILRVIEKYDHKRERNILTSIDYESGKQNYFSVYIQILYDFYENGIYKSENQKSILNGNGNIKWNETMNSSEAYIVNGVPFYLDYLTSNNYFDNGSIQLIHKAIMSEISLKLDGVLDLMDYEKVILTDLKLEDITSEYDLISILEKELRNQFIVKQQKTIKLLIEYLLKRSRAIDIDDLTFWGSKYFNLIWEDVCSVVYGNNLNNTFYELGLKVPMDELRHTTLKSYIEKPVWELPNGEYFQSENALQLDMLTIENGNMNIYDAKYYDIKIHDNKITGNPGIGDITKQFAYELAFQQIISLNNLTVSNQFIFPKDDLIEDEVIASNIKLSMFDRIGLVAISVIFRNSESMYKLYLK